MSTLIEKISEDFMTAYKAKDMDTKNFLGVVKGEVTRKTKEPADESVIAGIKSMIKNHNKSLEETSTPSLTDSELSLLETYLPQAISEEEIDKVIEEAIAGGANNMGAIMGAFKGMEVDKKLVSQKANQKLNN